jgi:hypothetical protein
VGQLDTEHEALQVQVLGREVVLLGKRGVAIALSGKAAAETAQRLAEAAAMAMAGQPEVSQGVDPGKACLGQASQTLPREE